MGSQKLTTNGSSKHKVELVQSVDDISERLSVNSRSTIAIAGCMYAVFSARSAIADSGTFETIRSLLRERLDTLDNERNSLFQSLSVVEGRLKELDEKEKENS
jgi:hypothetical protein